MSPALPTAASSFVGRAAEITALADLVSRERLVTLVGPGGCGKTRLAVEFARLGRVPLHGYVELAALGPRSDLPATVLGACGLREELGRDAVELLRDRLGRGGGLLVLDNCEHLRTPVSDLVADLLGSCAPLRVLVTSRVSLGLTGERVLPLTGLDPAGDGAALLLERARRVQPDLPDGPGAERAATHEDFVNINDIGAGPWREVHGRDAFFAFFGQFVEYLEGTFRQEIMDIVGYDDHVVAIVHETGTRHGHVFDNRAIYLCKIVDGVWTPMRTMDMDHDNINRFWAAVGMPAVESAVV